jgi:hypothetical protein
LTVVERDDLVPVCPHCEEELTEVYAKAKGFALFEGRTALFFCPHCLKVLGFGQSRML